MSPVRTLSGGERNRLLLAKLFIVPSNVLVLDEPTNDLDAETLELLEELLATNDGTLILVSHDRAFLDNVVTSTLVFEGGGKISEFVGGYSDWLDQSKQAESKQSQDSKPATTVLSKAPVAKKKLSYREGRELETLPGQIEAMEARQAELNQLINSAGFYKEDSDRVKKTLSEVQALIGELEAAYERWNELDALAESLSR